MITKEEIISCILSPLYGSLINYLNAYDGLRSNLSEKSNHELADLFYKYSGRFVKPKTSQIFYYQ